jgi:RsiW-degrading membrane proteinase PrsW (M82 family)
MPSAATTLGCSTLLLATTGFGMLCAGLETVVLAVQSPQWMLLAVALATICTVPHTLAVLWLDRHEGEPVWLVAAAFTWGALSATVMSGIVNTIGHAFLTAATGNADAGAFLTASLIAPVVEESTKGIALVALFVLMRREVDGVLDGIVYGALVGLGFAWFENITYYMRVSGEGPVTMMALAWIRGVLNGAGGHATFTGLTGLGLGLFRVMRGHRARWLIPPIALLAAIFAHFTWNTFSGVMVGGPLDNPTTLLVAAPIAVAVLQLPFLAFLLFVAALVLRHEEQLIRTFLLQEPADVAHPEDLVRLVPARRRLWASARVLLQAGPIGWWHHRSLGEALIELAFARWHHAADQLPWPADEDAQVLHLRARIRALRARGAHL